LHKTSQISRLTGMASQSALETATPSVQEMTAHFGQYIWGQDHSNKLYRQSCKRRKKDKNDCQHHGFRRRRCIQVQQENHQSSFRQEGSGYVPANFQAEKSHIVISGPV
jgi:hypothetical protein